MIEVSQQPSSTSPKRPIEPRDLCRLRAVGEVELHADDRSVVYQVTWPDADSDSNRAQLYTVGIDSDDNRQLTHGHRDHTISFSPDRTRLLFLRSEPKQPTKVMVLAWPVGEIRELATFEDGASVALWLDDDRIAVLAPRRPDTQIDVDDDELARRPRIITRNNYRFNGQGWIHDRPQQIFVIDLTSDDRTPRELGPAGVNHRAMVASPDGDRIAAIAATDDDADLTGTSDVWLYSTDGDAAPTRLTEHGGSWGSVMWHDDGTLLVTGLPDNTRTGFDKPYRLGLPGTDAVPSVQPFGTSDQNLAPGAMAGVGWVAVEDGLLLPGSRSGRVALDHYRLHDGQQTVVHEDDHQIRDFAAADGGIIVAAITSTERPADLWRLDGTPRILVALNDAVLAELDLGRTETVSVASTGGAEVQAFVVRPPESAPAVGDRHPGLIYVHGGPMTQFGFGFFDEFQMAAALGYVVIGGNPRGSDGYGEAWAVAIIGDLGNKDWDDVQAMTDHLAALPEVDEDRIGIGGGSYGGFMTSWALGHSSRYKAGLVERAVTSWTTMFGTSDIGNWFTEKTIGASPESQPERMEAQSPLSYAANIETPTLILHSEEDWRCPIEQAEQLFAAIRRNGGDVTLVRFPGENHELSRSGIPSHRIERLEIVHEFYATHLGGADFGSHHFE